MSWEVQPEPADTDERAALVAAAERALAAREESAWWRSGFDDLDGAALPEQSRERGPVEP